MLRNEYNDIQWRQSGPKIVGAKVGEAGYFRVIFTHKTDLCI